MKVASTVSVKKGLTSIFAMVCLVCLPAIGICGPGGPGNAGNPDEVVPFDPNMNLAFLAIGLLFAAVVVVKQLNKRKVSNAA